MEIIDIRVAKRRLTSLIERAAQGEPFIISKKGVLLVKVEAVERREAHPTRRLGFLQGQFLIPDDFDNMGAATISTMFGTKRKKRP